MLSQLTYGSLVLFLFLSKLGTAHPGHDLENEIAQREHFFAHNEYRSLGHCATQLKAREAERIVRRKEIVHKLRKKRSVVKRDITDDLATDHKSNASITPDYPNDYIFSPHNSCILSPESIEGPYYISGEYIRRDVTDDEFGVPLFLDYQLINMVDCEPLPNVALELWHSNATGVYGGVVAEGNGNVNDLSNINNTALRGIQFTDSDGVVEFETIFPGHYIGRTTHVHVLAQLGAQIQENHTVTGGRISHVGQLYFDQKLIDTIEATEVYNTNTQPLTTNVEDRFISSAATEDADPFHNYVYLGDDVSDGIFGWITFGIDPRTNRTIYEAGHYGEGGGVANTIPYSLDVSTFMPPPTPTPMTV